MMKDVLISALQFLLLVIFQVFILDNIALSGYINPIVYIWFIILLPKGTARWLVLLSSFAIGMCVDIFSGDIGVNALVCTFIGFLRLVLSNTFFENIDGELKRPCIATQGLAKYLIYITTMVLTHRLLCLLIGTFAWAEFGQIMIKALISTIISVVFIVILDMIFYAKKD